MLALLLTRLPGHPPRRADQDLQADALDELRLRHVPVVFGCGTRLLAGGTSPSVRLRLARATGSPRATQLANAVQHATG